MNKEKVWKDINHSKLSLNEISDKYLLNILKFVEKGRGHVDYLNEDRIRKLFKEADDRKLKHSCDVNKAIGAINAKKRVLRELQYMKWWEFL